MGKDKDKDNHRARRNSPPSPALSADTPPRLPAGRAALADKARRPAARSTHDLLTSLASIADHLFVVKRVGVPAGTAEEEEEEEEARRARKEEASEDKAREEEGKGTRRTAQPTTHDKKNQMRTPRDEALRSLLGRITLGGEEDYVHPFGVVYSSSSSSSSSGGYSPP